MILSNSNFKFENTNLTNIRILFGLIISSTGSIDKLLVENMDTRAAMNFRDCYSITIRNSEYDTMYRGLASIFATDTHFEEISNVKFHNISLTNCILLRNSHISLIQNATFENIRIGIEMSDRSGSIINSINVTRDTSSLASDSWRAINLYDSNITIQNSTFINNSNDKGGAIYIQ